MHKFVLLIRPSITQAVIYIAAWVVAAGNCGHVFAGCGDHLEGHFTGAELGFRLLGHDLPTKDVIPSKGSSCRNGRCSPSPAAPAMPSDGSRWDVFRNDLNLVRSHQPFDFSDVNVASRCSDDNLPWQPSLEILLPPPRSS